MNSNMDMNRDFDRIIVHRISRKNSLKRNNDKKLHSSHLKTSQSYIRHRTNLNSTRFANISVCHSGLSTNSRKMIIINSEQNKEQENQISSSIKEEKMHVNLSDPIQDFHSINSIRNSTTYFDMYNTHRILSRNHRISPINDRNLCQNEFTTDIFEKKKRKKKRSKLFFYKLGLCILLLLLLIGGIIAILIYALNQSTSSTTTTITTVSSVLTTTQNSACTTGGIICPAPIFSTNGTGNCTRSSISYLYYTCCYQAISTQLTIEFKLIEQVSHWSIDDVSMTQGNGELIINGGFEANLTGWIITSANHSITPLAYFSPGTSHSGLSYLHSEATLTSDSIKQTVNVIQGQYVNVSFWWRDEGGSAGPTERCEGTITLTP